MRKRGVLILACAFGVLALAQTSPGAGLRTGFMDPYAFTEGGSSQLAFQRAGNAGATAARLVLTWRAVAPGGSVKPGGFDATDSNSPQYNQAQWAAFDLQVRRAVEAGLDPIVSISLAPDWAEGPEDWLPGTVRPDPTEFGLFAQAAAKRYSGLFPGLEGIRVRYWQAWNEPNIKDFFWPHFLNGVLFSPGHYRQMVNAFAANVRSVATNDGTTNLVVAGGLAPFGHTNQVGPLRFMRAMLCISKTNRAVAGCGTGVNFDIWSTHPYTEGGPTHAALSPDNVSIGDLPDMRAVLRAALRAGHVRANRPVEFWVTEFSWDSKPADPRGVPSTLHARWTAEALYRMSRAGVSLVTWFQTRDHPFPASPYQSGFYYCGSPSLSDDNACGYASSQNDVPKRSLQAFRFPFVVFAARSRISAWGRTPTSQLGSVRIERKTRRGWKGVKTLSARSTGIFSGVWRSRDTRGLYRARFLTDPTWGASVPFSLVRPRDRTIFPFGCGGGIPCRATSRSGAREAIR